MITFKEMIQQKLKESQGPLGSKERNIEVDLGVGLGPGIKKFAWSERDKAYLFKGKDVQIGQTYTAKLELKGKDVKVTILSGKIGNKIKQRIIDAFDAINIDVSF